MQKNKHFIFLLIFSVLCCCQSPANKGDKKNSKKTISHERKFINDINGYLPNFIDDTKFMLIYRLGSIEYASDVSVLCIPLDSVDNETIRCNYFMFNNIDSSHDIYLNEQDSDEPKTLGFEFLLKNKLFKKKISLANLKLLHINDLNEYVVSKLTDNPGEGHCNNFYYISARNKDSIYVLDNQSRIMERDFFKSLFQQISPSEYYQSLSLNEKCLKDIHLYQKLNSDQYRDSFKLIHNDLGRYW